MPPKAKKTYAKGWNKLGSRVRIPAKGNNPEFEGIVAFAGVTEPPLNPDKPDTKYVISSHRRAVSLACLPDACTCLYRTPCRVSTAPWVVWQDPRLLHISCCAPIECVSKSCTLYCLSDGWVDLRLHGDNGRVHTPSHSSSASCGVMTIQICRAHSGRTYWTQRWQCEGQGTVFPL